MRLTLELPYLKIGKAGNAKYRRKVTSEAMRAMVGKDAIEWSLKTKDPLKIVDAWKEAHTRFEALLAKAEETTVAHIEWEMLHKAAVEHGLVRPEATQIGPVDAEMHGALHSDFTSAILDEAGKLSVQQMNVPFANNPPKTANDLLIKAQVLGVTKPPVLLSEGVKHYLRDREKKSSYPDIEKQVGLVVAALGEAMSAKDPEIKAIDEDAAYTFRDNLIAKGNAISTVERRVTTIKAILNAAKKRFRLREWDNPFNGMELPVDDGHGGEVKRDPLTLDEIRRVREKMHTANQDLQDIWHLMLFSGLGPNECRGLQWSEIYLDDPTPHFEVKANARRRLKAGERHRRVPLVGSALAMMRRRHAEAVAGEGDVFPRYSEARNANSLSAALVKPMKAADVWVKSRKVPYSLRHSVKDWLRRTTPTNIQLLLMGHGHGEGRSASGYGGDDLLDKQAEYLEAALKVGGVFDYPDFPGS